MAEEIDDVPPRSIDSTMQNMADYYGGDPDDLLFCIGILVQVLAEHHPELKRLATDFVDSSQGFLMGNFRTLDDAFNVEGRWKGVRLADYRFRRDNSHDIFKKIEALIKPKNPTKAISQEAAFAKIAEGYPVGESVIRDLYRWQKKDYQRLWDELISKCGPDIKKNWLASFDNPDYEDDKKS